MKNKELKLLNKRYRKLHKPYAKKYKFIAKDCAPWDYGWLLDFIHITLQEMQEYYKKEVNVAFELDGVSRIAILDTLLEKYKEYELAQQTLTADNPDADQKKLAEFFELLGKTIMYLWD